MATKTITLELDAYEKLKRAKRGRESFSQVVRRLQFDRESSTGAKILTDLNDYYAQKAPIHDKTLEYWDTLNQERFEDQRISPSHWDS
jgi:ribose 1,5-bisphosphokinase PhnN